MVADHDSGLEILLAINEKEESFRHSPQQHGPGDFVDCLYFNFSYLQKVNVAKFYCYNLVIYISASQNWKSRL